MVEVRVKICGLRTEADVAAVAAAGAAYAGFVFFAKSPRNLTLPEAKRLALAAPVGLAKVALTVDADDATLDALVAEVPLDLLQLHGHETPARVAEVRARFGLPVMKAIGTCHSLGNDCRRYSAQFSVGSSSANRSHLFTTNTHGLYSSWMYWTSCLSTDEISCDASKNMSVTSARRMLR